VIAATIAAPVLATEDCGTNKPQPGVRRHIEKLARQLMAPDPVDANSLWFCAHGGAAAEAVILSAPRRLADGSDLVQRAWCQRYDEDRPTRWNCHVTAFRQARAAVKIADASWPFTIVLVPEAGPDFARRIVDQALALSSEVTTQNFCASPPAKEDLEAFHSRFATRPSPREKPTFVLYRNEHYWQVVRNMSSLTIAVPEDGAPQLKCWSVARGDVW